MKESAVELTTLETNSETTQKRDSETSCVLFCFLFVFCVCLMLCQRGYVKMMRKYYLVSIDFYGAPESLKVLREAMIDHVQRAYGKPLASRLLIDAERIAKMSLVSPLSKKSSLDRHLDTMVEGLGMARFLQTVNERIQLKSIVLSIGVLYRESVTCTIPISIGLLRNMSRLNLPVEIVCYPSEKNQGGRVPREKNSKRSKSKERG